MKPRLIGAELLQTIAQFSEMSRSELAKKCGYINRSGNAQIEPYLVAILEAKGESFGTTARAKSTDTQAFCRIQSNGQFSVPRRFNAAIECNPGDCILVEVDVEAGVISIKKDPYKTQKSQIASIGNGRRRSKRGRRS